MYRIVWYLYAVMLIFYLGCMSKHITLHKCIVLLPRTNEVWGGVMFLHLSVILFTLATEAGGTYSTGMHTCFHVVFKKCSESENFATQCEYHVRTISSTSEQQRGFHPFFCRCNIGYHLVVMIISGVMYRNVSR